MNVRPARLDAVDAFKTEADIAAYLGQLSEDANPALLTSALGEVARAGNMSKLARDTGISRVGLTKALSRDGNPRFETVAKVAKALGLRITFAPAGK